MVPVVRLVRTVALLLLGSPCTEAHSSLLFPPSRNAVDKDLGPWRNGGFGVNVSSGVPPDNYGCDCVNATRRGAVPCEVAQSCFYFSNGCSIGCAECDGGEGSNVANPNIKDRCNSGKKQTLPQRYWTTHLNATPGSEDDMYKYNPWRSPGSSPVFDPCGMAGGNLRPAGGEAKYASTQHAKQGFLGSKLPPAPAGTIWMAGGTAQTAITIRANHGGGYSFRLCPVNSSLSEECFRNLPLPFVPGEQTLRWGSGRELRIGGMYTTEGTTPPNSSWARLPLPYRYCHGHTHPSTCDTMFTPPCNETMPMHSHSDQPTTGEVCSGANPNMVIILDTLRVPPSVPPGEYVLGFRWDCEVSAQVWAACADVTIVASSEAVKS